jgi:amidase
MSFDISVENAVERIRKYDERTRVYVSTRLPEALSEAWEKSSPRSPLHGLPYGLKDEFDTLCLPTTAGSWRHRDRRPTRNSGVYEAFAEAGAILVGKTNLSDMGLAPEASSYVAGSTVNPFDLARTAGGSSGGSAAAVAYGYEAFDWGTDIGGSIRMPAAFCGVLGMRLSDETWPLPDLFPSVPPALKWMCGQGPFTRTTAQMRIVLDAVAPRLRIGKAPPFDLAGAAIYAPEAGVWPSFERDVRAHLGDLPIDRADLDPPALMREINGAMWASHFEDLLESDRSVTLASGLRAVLSSVIFRGKLGDRRFHPATAELLLAIALGRITVFRDRDAARARALSVRDSFRRYWDKGIVIVAPVTAHPPPRIGRANWNTELLSYTVAGNLADSTALSIPFGTFDGRLPRSIQLMGPPGSEHTLLDLADRIIASRDRDRRLAAPRSWLD